MSFTSIALRCLACGGKLGSHFLWTGDGAYHHACFPSSPKEDELASLRAQVASLQKELAERTAERDAALSEVDDLQSQAEVVAEEFEKDCWKAMRSLLSICNFNWQDVQPDGVTADDAREYISTTLDELEKGEQRWKARADTLARRVERLEAALTPSADTKAAYMGEIVLTITYRDDNGNELTRDKDLPWTTIKEVMALIRARAALKQKDGGNG